MIKWIFPLVSIILALGIVLFPFFSFHKKDERYSFARYFPCEMASSLKDKIILLGLGTLFSMCAAESYVSNLFLCRSPIFLTAMILEILSLLALLAVLAYGLDYLKIHIIADLIFAIGEGMGDVSLLLGVLIDEEKHYPFSLALGVVMGLVGLALLVLLFLPKLKRWAYLDKSEEDGKVVYVRPKVSPLALIEWIYLFGQIFNLILLAVNGILNQ
jgi:hypothetical protein